MKILFQRILQFVLLLVCIQAVRAALHWGLWIGLHAAGSPVLENAVEIAAYSATGILFLLVFRPSRTALGLNWQAASRREKTLYLAFAALLGLGVGTSYFLQSDILVENIKAALVIPVFEELIFRGWGWGRIESALSGKYAQVSAWLILSALFALWHIGYTDIFFLKVLPANPGSTLGEFLLWKVIFTFFFGLAVGFLRWRTDKVYGSVILHGFLNLFGK